MGAKTGIRDRKRQSKQILKIKKKVITENFKHYFKYFYKFSMTGFLGSGYDYPYF